MTAAPWAGATWCTWSCARPASFRSRGSDLSHGLDHASRANLEQSGPVNLEPLSREFQQRFDRKMAARERALSGARRAIRSSANAIRAIHRQDRARADELMEEARAALQDGEEAVGDHPDVAFAGFLQDAQKEYAEAR